jgi:drug/metabolite transporter (DMT)-like permease
MPVIFVLIWSTGFIVARMGMPYAPPFSFLEIRYVFSLILFIAWIHFAGAEWPIQKKQYFHLAVTGALMHAGYLGGVWAAVKLGMGAGLSALIVGLQPVLTGIWLSARGGVVKRLQWVGLILGFIGVFLVLFQKLEVTTEVSNKSLICACLALLSITSGTLYQKRYVAPCDVRTANFIQLISAALFTLPLAMLETETIQLTSFFWVAMCWSVIGLTLGGSSLLYLLIQRGAATTVTSLMYLVPPCTAVIAWLLFDESITKVTLVGIVVTALGVALVARNVYPAK